MQYNYKYRLTPSEATRSELRRHIDICRQLYNDCLYKFKQYTDDIPARYDLQGQLPDLKKWWADLKDVHSKVLQIGVKRVYNNLSTLKAQKDNGRPVGMLKWKRPRDYRSLTYNQTGFKFKNTSGRSVLSLSKIGDVPIRLHRDIPEDASLKQVTVKREPTGEWVRHLRRRSGPRTASEARYTRLCCRHRCGHPEVRSRRTTSCLAVSRK
jgi:putative transposase